MSKWFSETMLGAVVLFLFIPTVLLWCLFAPLYQFIVWLDGGPLPDQHWRLGRVVAFVLEHDLRDEKGL